MYLSWKEETIVDFSDANIEHMYNEGFVFTRIGKGVMNQTRSLRIDLNNFEFSSENRRVLGKTEDLALSVHPIPYEKYDWSIHKMGKEFYEKKFGEKTFSAQKIKELITNKEKSNFNRLLVYIKDEKVAGYCIALETKNTLHYCYPFYELGADYPNLGMGMMLKAIMLAKESGKKYIYLGSFQRPTDTYKLQFSGLEWFGGTEWKNDLDQLKDELKTVM
jgi:arginyl-tRNA--protein-N-Asp/Glu arginylyltransferase